MAFYNCDKIITLDFQNLSKIYSGAFDGCHNLKHCIIRTPSVASTASSNIFDDTIIATGKGAIYVPSELIGTYKSHDLWKRFFIADINDCPLDDFSTIKDDWDTIISNINSGNYSKYKIGDTKMIDLGSLGKHYMQLVAKDEDIKSDGSGKAPTTWVSKDVIALYKMYNNRTGSGRTGWASSNMRTWLNNTVKPLIPENIRNSIVQVNKVQSIYNNNLIKDGQTTQDSVWIPSYREIIKSTSTETTNVVYEYFDYDSSKRAKYYDSYQDTSWWLRSVIDNDRYFYLSSSSSGSYGSSDSQFGVALGFCIGSTNESQQWQNLLDAIENDTYRDEYSIGDELPYTTTDGYTYHAVIAGFGLDEDENGNEAHITFITRKCLISSRTMNNSNTTTGGWGSSVLRTTTLSEIKTTLPSYITENLIAVKKVQSIYSNNKVVKNGQTTYDELWIPSVREVGLGNGYESVGPIYSGLFNNDNQRIKNYKYSNYSSCYWWLRSTYDSSKFCAVTSNGTINNYGAGQSYPHVAIGFCL